VSLRFLYERRVEADTTFTGGAIRFTHQPATFKESTMMNAAYATTHVATWPRAGATASASRSAVAAMLTPSDILLDLDVPTKDRTLEEIAGFMGTRRGLVAGDVHACLVGRERIGSTAVGCGLAIPHARVKGLLRPIAAFVRTKLPIPFDAPDGKPVSDLFALLVPRRATETHLLLLAQVAKMFCDVSFREELRMCADVDGIHAAFARWRQP
jgi:nitrogen PTS system EIIA component